MMTQIKSIIKAALIYLYDLKNDIKYSTLKSGNNTQEKLLSSLVVSAHTIEKGLTMPNKRFPFGEAKAREIITGCNLYIRKGYDTTESRFVDVVGIMKEYRDVNAEHGVQFPSSLNDSIKSLTSIINGEKNLTQHYAININDYFTYADSDFSKFANSRHSCRNLPGHVEQDALDNAIALSMNAPSTCNRQSQRIHLLQSDEAKKAILSIQGGSRGFGELADQFILITSDLSCWTSGPSRNGPYLDGGIYLMNLLYSLHHNKIAACTLNLYLNKSKTKKLHKSLNIPQNEVPVALIAIGIPPETFDLARSHRRDSEEVITRH